MFVRLRRGQWRVELPDIANALHVYLLRDGARYMLCQVGYGSVKEFRKKSRGRSFPACFEKVMGANEMWLHPAADAEYDLEIQSLPKWGQM